MGMTERNLSDVIKSLSKKYSGWMECGQTTGSTLQMTAKNSIKLLLLHRSVHKFTSHLELGSATNKRTIAAALISGVKTSTGIEVVPEGEKAGHWYVDKIMKLGLSNDPCHMEFHTEDIFDIRLLSQYGKFDSICAYTASWNALLQTKYLWLVIGHRSCRCFSFSSGSTRIAAALDFLDIPSLPKVHIRISGGDCHTTMYVVKLDANVRRNIRSYLQNNALVKSAKKNKKSVSPLEQLNEVQSVSQQTVDYVSAFLC